MRCSSCFLDHKHVHVPSICYIVTPRPTDNTGEFEDCSDEVEELCRSELKKGLRVPEEQAPLKDLDLTYTGHPMKILETSERVTRNRKNKACRM